MRAMRSVRGAGRAGSAEGVVSAAVVNLARASRPRECVARGWFVTAGYAPDGDTLRFRAR